MNDRNLNAWVGPDFNGKTVDMGDVAIDAASDGYASALKFSVGLRDFKLVAGVVTGGHDACVDINNLCHGIDVYCREWRPTGQFAATVKGGSTETLLRGDLWAHGRIADVIYGDWSDQSHEKTTGNVLAINSRTGKPVRVLVLKGTKPLLTPGTGPYEFRFPSPDMPMHDLAVYGFETLRRWGFFRSQSNR